MLKTLRLSQRATSGNPLVDLNRLPVAGVFARHEVPFLYAAAGLCWLALLTFLLLQESLPVGERWLFAGLGFGASGLGFLATTRARRRAVNKSREERQALARSCEAATAERVGELEAELERLELERLGTQLEPHFLFNALQVVSYLLGESPERADRALMALSTLLREVLELSGEQSVALDDELELGRRFVSFHRDHSLRRVIFTERVDPAALDASIPPLLLQPLIENALMHSGDGSVEARARIEWIVRRRNGSVRIEIHNSGRPDATKGFAPRPGGIGLPNTEKRLRLYFGNNCEFELRKRIGGGAVASLLIPYQPHSVNKPMERTDADSNGDSRRRASGA